MLLNKQRVLDRIDSELRTLEGYIFNKIGRFEAGLTPSFQDRHHQHDFYEKGALPRTLLPANSNFDIDGGGLDVENLELSNIGEVSIDLRVGEDIFSSETLFSDIKGIDNLLELEREGAVKRISLVDDSFLLNPDTDGGNIYYIPSFEKLKLPSDLELVVDGKSTTGRVFAMCNDRSKVYFDGIRGSSHFNRVIVSVQPYSFPLIVRPGRTSLFQAIIRYRGSNLMSHEEVRRDKENVSLFEHGEEVDLTELNRFGKDGLILRYDVKRVLRARLLSQIPGPIDMDMKGELEVLDYFDMLDGDGSILLDARRAYLTGTLERIKLGNICGHISRESEDSGTGIWGHFAGRIQPGYHGRLTMETFSNVRRQLERGSYAGFVEFDKMEGPLNPRQKYNGSYTNQIETVPQPPKMFKTLK